VLAEFLDIMMNKVISAIAWIFLSVLFCSCEKVINVNLDTAPNQIVVEGNITDKNEIQTVKITQSVPYTDQNVYPAVKGALVTVTDNVGNSWSFKEIEPGIYTVGPFKGITGRTYMLNVSVNNKVYTARSVMPRHVKMDSLSLKIITFEAKDYKQIQVHYKDPREEENQYRWIMKINNVQTRRIFVTNDRFTNGNRVSEVLYYTKEDNEPLVKGHKVWVEAQSIDKNIFTYWFTLSQQIMKGPGGGVTPGNPPSNISNNALGYFSAHTTEALLYEVR